MFVYFETLLVTESKLIYSSTTTNKRALSVEPVFLQIFKHCFYPCVQSLEHRLHSANHSLQATPNSTIHSLVHQVHPPLVDLWNTGQMEAYQAEAGGYIGVAAVVEPSMCVPSGDEMVGTEHSPLLEQQEEEEEIKVNAGLNYITL